MTKDDAGYEREREEEFEEESVGEPEEDAGYCQEKYGPYVLSAEEVTLG